MAIKWQVPLREDKNLLAEIKVSYTWCLDWLNLKPLNYRRAALPSPSTTAESFVPLPPLSHIPSSISRSSNDVFDDVAVNISQSEVPSRVAIGEPLMVKAQQVQ